MRYIKWTGVTGTISLSRTNEMVYQKPLELEKDNVHEVDWCNRQHRLHLRVNVVAFLEERLLLTLDAQGNERTDNDVAPVTSPRIPLTILKTKQHIRTCRRHICWTGRISDATV